MTRRLQQDESGPSHPPPPYRTGSTEINIVVSLYLDFTRLMAAIVVVVSHIWPVMEPNFPLPWPAHEAVIVFFVLSGYVIAHTVATRERSFTAFLFNRITRVGSVTVPALTLGALFSLCVPLTISDVFPLPSGSGAMTRDSLISVLFLGETWWSPGFAPLNAPYWSLNFEVWYYVMFGAWHFIRSNWRWPLCAALFLAVGPKIVLLFPCFLMGVGLYRHQAAIRLSERAALALLAGTAIFATSLWWLDIRTPVRTAIMQAWPWFSAAGAANQVVTDSLYAAAFAVSILAVSRLARYAKPLFWFEPGIRWGANRTLSIYLLHAPLFAFLWAALDLRGWSLVTTEAASILLIAQATERQLDAIRRIMAHVLMPGGSGRDTQT